MESCWCVKHVLLSDSWHLNWTIKQLLIAGRAQVRWTQFCMIAVRTVGQIDDTTNALTVEALDSVIVLADEIA